MGETEDGMKRVLTAAVVTAGGAGVVLARRLQGRTQPYGSSAGAEPRSRWRVVTINRSPDEVMPDGQVPEPLARLGDLVEVEMSAAPGNKGTELRARLRSAESPSGAARLFGQDPRQQLRSALREAKQLIEVGEVLRVDPVPHGKRTPTPTGWLVELAAKRASGEGVL
jgi:hypothetical protein